MHNAQFYKGEEEDGAGRGLGRAAAAPMVADECVLDWVSRTTDAMPCPLYSSLRA